MFSRDFYAGQHDRARHRLGLRRAGLLHAVLHRGRGRRRRTSGSRCSSGLGLDVRWVDARRGRRDATRRWRPGRPSGRRTRRVTATSTRRATCWPTPLRSSRARRRRPRAHRVHRARRSSRRPGRRRPHLGRRHRHRAGRADRRARARATVGAAGRRPRSRPAAPGTRSSSPSAHPDLAPDAAADGLRPGVGHLLAAREERRAVGDEQPGRGAGRGPRVRLGLLRQDAGARRRAACPATAGSGPAPGLGRDHRLHPRPPADPRARPRPATVP